MKTAGYVVLLVVLVLVKQTATGKVTRTSGQEEGTGQREMDPAVDLALHSGPLRVGTTINTGFYIDLINVVAQSLNFSYELVLPADGEWGVEHGGQWTGVMGLLQRKEIDMAFILAPSSDRSRVAQWTVPVVYWYISIGVRTRNVQPDLWTAFFSPFHWSVYVSTLISLVLCTCCLRYVTRSEQQVLSGQQIWSLGEVGQLLYGSLLGRGFSWSGAGSAGRPLIAGWCILGFVLTSCYTSKLTSLLVGVTPVPPFTSVEEMLAQDEYRWGVNGGSKLPQVLRDSNKSTEQELYKRVMTFAKGDPDVVSRDLDVHLSKVLSEKYAFLGPSYALDKWAAEHCEITVLPVKLTGLEYFSVFLPKDSVITGEVNDVVLRLHDTGVLPFLSSQRLPPVTRCHGNQSPQQTFSLATFQGPFNVAAAGLLLAAGILCVERCRHRRDV